MARTANAGWAVAGRRLEKVVMSASGSARRDGAALLLVGLGLGDVHVVEAVADVLEVLLDLLLEFLEAVLQVLEPVEALLELVLEPVELVLELVLELVALALELVLQLLELVEVASSSSSFASMRNPSCSFSASMTSSLSGRTSSLSSS